MTTDNNNSDVKAERIESRPEVQQEFSKVAANPKQSILIIIAICAIFGYLFFNLFLSSKGSDKSTSSKTTALPKDVAKPVSSVDDGPAIPQLPELPKLVAPKEAPPPPPPAPTMPKEHKEVALPSAPLPKAVEVQEHKLADPVLPLQINNSDDAMKRRDAKRKSSMVLVAGSPEKKTAKEIQQETDFVHRGEMGFVLGRGKIIEAILETAINSDLGGEVRAIISRDVYAEASKVILIPKGSKAFGKYSTSSDGGAYGRVTVEWFRIDLANGYTINLTSAGSNGIDGLGRPGIQGRVDNKFKEQMANVVLMSAFNIAIANALDKVVAPPLQSSAATANQSVATSLQNILSSISSQTSLGETAQVNQICAQTQAAITDKTSSAYTSLAQACTQIQTQTGAAAGQRLSSITSSVNSAVASLLTTSASNLTTTQAQDASKQAFTDITDSVKTMIGQNTFKPTITVNQGVLIKIYVNKDYVFPKAALKKSKVIK
jgi:type IV secretion system protein VirB10